MPPYGLSVHTCSRRSRSVFRWASPSGVVVTGTIVDRLAVDSGLLVGDVIHSLNRTPITTVDGLRAAFSLLKPGEPGALQIERDGKLTYLTFELL
jgi:serine protease Do